MCFLDYYECDWSFSDVCVSVPTQWAAETAWTPRRGPSPSWATGESERGNAHAGEPEKLSVSVIIRSRWALKTQSSCHFPLITFHSKSLHLEKKWTDRRQENPSGITCWTSATWDQEARVCPKNEKVNKFTACRSFWNLLSCSIISRPLFPVCGSGLWSEAVFHSAVTLPVLYNDYMLSEETNVSENISCTV